MKKEEQSLPCYGPDNYKIVISSRYKMATIVCESDDIHFLIMSTQHCQKISWADLKSWRLINWVNCTNQLH